MPTISFFQYSRAFRPLLTALEQSDFIPSAPVQHPLVDGLRFRRDPFKRMAEAMGAEPLDQVSSRVIRTVILHGDDPQLDRCRTEIVFHDHVASSGLISMQLEAGEHKSSGLLWGASVWPLSR